MENILAACRDDTFGPGVKSPECRGGFDFTVSFEESILTILPAACFLLLIPLRAARLLRRRIKVKSTSFHIVKLVAIGAYVTLQLALLILSSTSSAYFKTRFSIASTALNLLAASGLALLSHLEHVKSIRPSFVIAAYLSVSLLFDIARVRTQWLLRTNDAVAALQSTAIAAKVIMLLLEAASKKRILLAAYRGLSPENTSGLFGRGFFWWLNSLLLNGFKNVLSADDIFPINENLSSRKLSVELQTRWNKCNQTRKHALMLQALSGFRWEIVAMIFPRLCLLALNVSQPFLINSTIKFTQNEDNVEPQNNGYGLIGAFTFVYVGTAHLSYRLMAMIRGSLIGMIYGKLATLDVANVNESSAMTLMGTDVERIVETWHELFTDVWASVLQLGIATYLLQRQIGAVCVVPIIFALVSTAVSSKSSGYVAARQAVWLEAIKERVNFTSEILGTMKSVKMLGLSEKMEALIQGMRIRELRLSKKFRHLSTFNICLRNLPDIFTQFLTFTAFAVVAKIRGDDSFSVSVAVTTLAIISLLDQPLSVLLGAIPTVSAALSCFQRIQEFLCEDSKVEQRVVGSVTGHSTTDSSPRNDIELISRSVANHEPYPPGTRISNEAVIIKAAEFGWSENQAAILGDVTMRIPSGARLTMIVGSVGSGKSTLLKGILGETSIAAGSTYVSSAEIAFCEQTCWIINGSVRENIVAKSSHDDAWYDTVVRACALDVDIQHMPSGDATIVGSQGIILSGGQRQRLSIARAVYSRKHLAIFDDVFSGLDTVTEHKVFSQVFGKRGLLAQTGTSAILATHGVHRLSDADHIVVLGKTGQILEQGTYEDLSISGEYVQALARESKEERRSRDNTNDNLPRQELVNQPTMSDTSRQTGDWNIYVYYTKSLGLFGLLTLVFLVSMKVVFGFLQYLWITRWAKSSENHPNAMLGYWLGVYFLFTALSCLMLGLAVFHIYVVLVPKSANSLHLTTLKAAMRAPISFFATTDTGELINRFSQDMRLVDMTLPGALVSLLFQLFWAVGSAALVVAAVPYFAASIPLIVGILYLVQRFYLRTSRQLRLLELEAKAPIYSHFIETLHGLVTIRAFGWVEAYKSKNLRLVDESQKPFYLLLCIQRWLTLVLDLIVAGMAILLVALAVCLRGNTSAGILGIALVNITGLGYTLADLITQWTTLETSLGAIARIKSFSTNTPSELLEGEDVTPDAEWPAHGALTFENVSASYGDSAPVLNNVNMTILPGQKIGICGRTGSGKSSFISSILRMVNLTSGAITLDGHDISTLPRPLIRQRLICLTQDPFLFTGSIRLNADPLDEATDSQIASALQKVGLWDVIIKKVEGGDQGETKVLDRAMDENFLSHGQRQLFCLARALLRKSSVLILDEPTSSVDMKTDAQMQAIIRSEFKSHTIIMIAHRLDSLLDFDRVAVLDKGNLIEFGEPQALLKTGSAFGKLYGGTSE